MISLRERGNSYIYIYLLRNHRFCRLRLVLRRTRVTVEAVKLSFFRYIYIVHSNMFWLLENGKALWGCQIFYPEHIFLNKTFLYNIFWFFDTFKWHILIQLHLWFNEITVKIFQIISNHKTFTYKHCVYILLDWDRIV